MLPSTVTWRCACGWQGPVVKVVAKGRCPKCAKECGFKLRAGSGWTEILTARPVAR